MGAKTAAQRRRRVQDTLAWRARRKRGGAVLPIEVDSQAFDLMERFAGLDVSQVGNKQMVAASFGRLWRLALAALLREG